MSPKAPSPAHEVPLAEKLRQELLTTLETLQLRGRRVALLDFPHYPNVGDSAIWLGEQVVLRKLGARTVYACHARSYSRRRLARRIKDGVICLSGGGNFGDLYRAHQELRERVLADFPDNEIVQFPQTIRFADRSRISAVGDAVRRHRRFTLLVRDWPSLELAERQWGIPATLATDMAFALGSLARPRRSEVEVIALRQPHRESSGVLDRLGEYEIPVVDWGERDNPSVVRSLVRRSERIARDHPRLFGWAAHTAGAVSFNAMALERLERGRRVLERGRVVITDRLHGHILCLLADIPHVVLDNRYGKVLSFHDAWTSDSPLVRRAQSAEMAIDLARGLAEGVVQYGVDGSRKTS
jgi:pyruvyl transferase EpsO